MRASSVPHGLIKTHLGSFEPSSALICPPQPDTIYSPRSDTVRSSPPYLDLPRLYSTCSASPRPQSALPRHQSASPYLDLICLNSFKAISASPWSSTTHLGSFKPFWPDLPRSGPPQPISAPSSPICSTSPKTAKSRLGSDLICLGPVKLLLGLDLICLGFIKSHQLSS
uniref:Uncharacterized protein n=1 Tax=Fagus sylvatica TaxID=28930 RepID=A0A2N9FXU3_FAGSY